MNKLVIAACTLLGVASCDMTRGMGQPMPRMTFEHISPITLAVASYDAIPYQQSVKLPRGFVMSPAVLVHDYLRHRFNASGTLGKLRVEIRDVQVTHNSEANGNSVLDAVGLAQQDTYVVKVGLDVSTIGTSKYEIKTISLTGTRTINVSEHSSVAMREAAQMNGLDLLLKDLDASLRKTIRDELSPL